MRRKANLCVMGLALVVLAACQTSGYAALSESELEAAFNGSDFQAFNGSDFQIAPMVERRDTLTATGYSVIDVQTSEYPAQRRLLAIRAAKLDAYRALTEQVYGQYIDATTTVAEMVVRSDTFRSRVEGVIYGATLVQIEPRGGDTYEVTLALDKSIVNDLRVLYLDSISIAKG